MNHLYYGDNLRVLRDHVAAESVDLIYLDPPFNSNASYNQLFRGPAGKPSTAQIEAFNDTWHWTDAAEEAFGEVLRSGNGNAAEMLRAMRTFLGENDMMAYLAMMAVRLIELHRVLKPTGSLYLHCDPTASHYLKILLDAVFGARNFRNEIIWKRTSAHSSAHKFGAVHDVILFFGKTDQRVWNKAFQQYDEVYVNSFFTHKDTNGRRWRRTDLTGPGLRKGESALPWRHYNPSSRNRHWQPPSYFYDKYKSLTGQSLANFPLIERLQKLEEVGLIHWPTKSDGAPQGKRLLEDAPGIPTQDIWDDLKPIHNMSQERLGYPTQKPVALLERILSASSNPGNVVLDPFCGCGTTVHAAEKLARNWVGIDVTHLAIGLIEKRLRDAFPNVAFTTHGVPQDLAGARDLARRGRKDGNYYFEFEKWALSLLAAQPGNLSKKGADRGIDGNIYFGKTSRAIVSVKAGDNVSVEMVRSLDSVVKRETAEIGILLTLAAPTRNMVGEAAAAGQYEEPGFSPVPRIQIVTVEDALQLRDRAVRLPARRDDTFRKAAPDERAGRQSALDL